MNFIYIAYKIGIKVGTQALFFNDYLNLNRYDISCSNYKTDENFALENRVCS